MLAVICPGQGSQTPGMLKPWLELDGVADQLALHSAAAGIDLIEHGVESDAETIRDTAIAQPLIVSSGLVALRALFPTDVDLHSTVTITAGHSVGEFTAAAVCGALTPEQTLMLVAARGRAMAAAAAAGPDTGMSAILGGDPSEVAAKLAELNLVGANINGAGQVVAAGTLDDLAQLAEDPPQRARIMPLKVAGAFHTSHMESAVAEVRKLISSMAVRTPDIPLISNANAGLIEAGPELLDHLVTQISSPVRWDLCQDRLGQAGVTGIIELAPGAVLSGLARRTLPGVESVALKTPADLEAAQDLVRRHARIGDQT
ncbi:MAG TPA: ACP S-malonyltransferase [Actinomycetales bacterium]|nr:ACP S-malonyltransferase [Actinomycetales bacterium]